MVEYNNTSSAYKRILDVIFSGKSFIKHKKSKGATTVLPLVDFACYPKQHIEFYLKENSLACRLTSFHGFHNGIICVIDIYGKPYRMC